MTNMTRLIWARANIAMTISLTSLAACAPSGTRTTRNGGTVTTSGVLPDLAAVRQERRAGPAPESEWNRLGLWQKVAADPPTYTPTGYPPSLPRTELEGKWFVDQRDGKRLFVPNIAVGAYRPGVLRGEAAKHTNWKYTAKKAMSENGDSGFSSDLW